jgi:hypothetical protein
VPRTGSQRRGIERERALRGLLEADGYGFPPNTSNPPGLKDRWWVSRASGSLGDADLIAANWKRVPMLIEVKSTTAGPFSGFGLKDRAEILAAGELAGFDVWLCWWPPDRKPPRWFHPLTWPQRKLPRRPTI